MTLVEKRLRTVALAAASLLVLVQCDAVRQPDDGPAYVELPSRDAPAAPKGAAIVDTRPVSGAAQPSKPRLISTRKNLRSRSLRVIRPNASIRLAISAKDQRTPNSIPCCRSYERAVIRIAIHGWISPRTANWSRAGADR